jgi:hypothetical protein
MNGVVGSNGKKMPITPSPKEIIPSAINNALTNGLFFFLAFFKTVQS